MTPDLLAAICSSPDLLARWAADHGELHARLARVLAEIQDPTKNCDVTVTPKSGAPPYSFSYADLGALLAVVRPVLSRHGLSLVQHAEVSPDLVTVRTVVSYGLANAESCWSSPSSGKPQDIGGVLTYARRYTLGSLIPVFGEPDDDANAASGNAATLQSRPAKPPSADAERKAAIVARATGDAQSRGAERAMMQARSGLHALVERVCTPLKPLAGPPDRQEQAIGAAVDRLIAVTKRDDGTLIVPPDPTPGDILALEAHIAAVATDDARLAKLRAYLKPCFLPE